jgi:hypothetical protein
MGRRNRIRKDSSDSGGSVVGIVLLVIGIVVGIPAIITVLVLCVIFGLTFFAVKKGVEAGNEFVENVERQQEDFAIRQREEAAKLQKLHEAAIARNQKMQGEFIAKMNKGNEPKVELKAPQPISAGKVVDLMALIDPVQDKVHGDRWEMVNKGTHKELHCTEAVFVPRMKIPYIPPQEYDFMVTFSQQQLRNGISLIMPKPGLKSFFWYLGSDGGSSYGLAANPKNLSGNVPGLIRVNRPYTTIVQVRRDNVRVFLDGQQILEYKGNFTDLTCDDWRNIQDTRVLGIACDDPTIFHFVRIVEVTGAGVRTR